MKILKRIGITFLILIALLGMWIAVNSIDDRELSAEAKEMLKPFPEVPPEENGYEVISYIFADNFSVTSDRDNQKVNNIAKGKITDLDFSRKVIETKQKIINDAISASKKPSFKFPSPKEAYDLPRFQRFIQAARLILVKARIDLNDGNIDAALANLEGGVDFCKIL